MKKILLGVLAVFILLPMIPGGAFAQQRRQERGRCTDSDRSSSNVDQAGRGEDRFVRGRTTGYSQSRRQNVARHDSCDGRGRLVENYCDAVIGLAGVAVACQQGEICQNGTCVRAIVLDRCGEPEDGWQDGTTYVLNQDLHPTTENLSASGATCFAFEHAHAAQNINVILDCQGHSITGPESRRIPLGRSSAHSGGVFAGDGVKFSLRGCNISNFHTGFSFFGEEGTPNNPSQIRDNTFSNNGVGIVFGPNGEGHSFVNNSACDNDQDDVFCSRGDFSHMTGSDNRFHDVDNTCLRGQPAPAGLYSDCQ